MMAEGMDNELVDQRFRYDNKGFNYRAYLSWVEPIGHNNFIQATYSIRQNKQESLKTLTLAKREAKITMFRHSLQQELPQQFHQPAGWPRLKAVRAKYDYTVGLTVDPSHSTSENFVVTLVSPSCRAMW